MGAGEEPIGADQKRSSSDLLVLKLNLKHADAGIGIFFEGSLCSVICHSTLQCFLARLVAKLRISDMIGQEIVLIDLHLSRPPPLQRLMIDMRDHRISIPALHHPPLDWFCTLRDFLIEDGLLLYLEVLLEVDLDSWLRGLIPHVNLGFDLWGV